MDKLNIHCRQSDWLAAPCLKTALRPMSIANEQNFFSKNDRQFHFPLQQQQQQQQLTMCNDLGEGSRCCAAYSVVGAIFTLWVGVMISSQPFFIAGIEDADNAKSSAFGAFGMFSFTFILSALGIWHDSQNKAQPLESEGEYALATDEVPNYGTSS